MSTVVIFPCGSIIYWYTLFNFVLHCNMHVKVKSNSPFLKVETKHLAQISPVKSGQFYQFGNAGTFCLGKKPAWCYQYWVVFLWKLLNPDYCSRCLVLPEKKVLVDKNESSESEYMFQYDFFFSSTSIRNENVTSWCHLKYIIQSSSIDIVFLWRLQTWINGQSEVLFWGLISSSKPQV